MISRPTRNVFFPLVLGVLVVALLEVTAHIAIWAVNPGLDEDIRRVEQIYRDQTAGVEAILRSFRGTPRDQFDAVLGWRYRAGFEEGGDRINNAGLRGEREYSPTPDDSVLRIAVFGDSFVYGTEVGPPDTWANLAELQRPNLEVLNFGVGGYGTDQAYLRFLKEGRRYAPRVVVIGFAQINLRRNVNRYRRFITTHETPWTKPRFLLEDHSLVLLPNPISSKEGWLRLRERPELARQFGVDDHWYEPLIYENALYDRSASVRLFTGMWTRIRNRYLGSNRLFVGDVFNEDSEAFAVTLALLSAFARAVEETDAVPVVMVFPSREDVVSIRVGGQRSYQPLLEALEVETWDAAEAFPNEGGAVDPWFARGGHYSTAGNELIARWLVGRLASRFPDG